jgi:hypothetical protein
MLKKKINYNSVVGSMYNMLITFTDVTVAFSALWAYEALIDLIALVVYKVLVVIMIIELIRVV